jgi:hypothetical protein
MFSFINVKNTIYDVNRQSLQAGNYIFNIVDINNETICGTLMLERDSEFANNYEFKIRDYIKLLINSQFRFIGLCGINVPERILTLTEISDEETEESSQNDFCSICLNELSENRYILGCAHHFHENCIFRWLEENNSCPICRSVVDDSVINTENIVLEPIPTRQSPRRNRRPPVSPINRRPYRRRRASTPPRRRRRASTPPGRRNTIIQPQENIPRRSDRIAARQREYNQMFSSRNIVNLLR